MNVISCCNSLMFKSLIIPGHPSFGHRFRELVGSPKGRGGLNWDCRAGRAVSEMDSDPEGLTRGGGGLGGEHSCRWRDHPSLCLDDPDMSVRKTGRNSGKVSSRRRHVQILALIPLLRLCCTVFGD